MTGGPSDDDPDNGTDPLAGLRRTRNRIIAAIAGVAALILIGSCGYHAIKGVAGGSARDHITSQYHREATLDEGDVQAYIADGAPADVADQIAIAEVPTDRRSGDTAPGNVAGTTFMQYPNYLVALFPYGVGKTQVMLSRDYRSGYHHYHNYVGGYWVPSPSYGGSGSDNRGGGSGGGGK
ncbi:DUF4247 domain-containing protein [Gordonia sp. ABSL1-1]|uniref:DUF4247 domain-containing protein n=1 Tax=Gordonia sp. ABSL1-1 TaxID=3053923 RepID=UPI0025738BCE|nr:DUF4247 domain-containing protein [Gordonia sp. ABSL1-1]MDL9936963.1 DUF4247 domain-containing protein [Gordonia sp. ABSL1-1]